MRHHDNGGARVDLLEEIEDILLDAKIDVRGRFVQ